jgi:hypothetical protein
MKNLTIVLIAIFALCLPILAQTPDFQTVKTEKGMMVLNNNKVQAFSFLVAGSNPSGKQNDDGSLFIKTDSGGLYVHFVKTKDFLGTKKVTDELEILKAQREWDVANEEKAWKAKLNVDVDGVAFVKIFNLQNNLFPTKTISTVYWSFPAPDPENPNRSLYQTVLLGDVVLMIRTNLDKSVKVEEVRAFFKQILESITLLPSQKQTVPPKKKPLKGKLKRNELMEKK